MKNIFKKISSKVYIGACALSLAFGFASIAFAGAVSWAGPTTYGTIAHVTGTSVVQSTTYGAFSYANTSSANAGDMVAVLVYVHNDGNAPSANTYVKVTKSPNSGSSNSFTFSGSVSGGGDSASGSTTVNLSSNQTLTYIPGSLRVAKDRATTGYAVPNDTDIFSGSGLNIGLIQGSDTCGADVLCHQGYVALGFQVSSTTSTTYLCSNGLDDDGDGLIDMNDPGCNDPTDNNEYNAITPTTCTINNFTASPTTVTSGGYTTLSWNTTNCTTVTVDGVNYPVDGSGSFGPLFSGKTYTLFASNPYNSDSETAYVGVNSTPNVCTIDTFYATPTTVTSGNSTQLYWNTTNCTTVTVDGVNYPVDGNGTFGPLYSGKTYNIFASNGSSTDTDSLYVGVNTVNNCTIDTFYATPTTVTSGNYTTLYWNTSNCDQVSIDGVNYAVDGNGNFGPLYSGRSYQIQAWKTGQSPVSQSTYVSVDNYSNNNCNIDTFYATPTTVNSGNTTHLYWNTSNCDQVTVDGINYAVDGSGYFGPLYSGRNYVLNAWKTGQTMRTQTVYVGVNNYNPTTYACSDGYDNDGDGYIDMNDAGCYGTTDTDEYNYVAPVFINPTVTTLIPSNLTGSSARLNGVVYNAGNNTTGFYFQWGTNSNSLGSTTTSQTTLSNSSVTYFETLYGLSANTTYYYRAVARKNDGTLIYGDIKQFTTTVVTPVVNTITRVVTVPAPAPTVPDRGVVVGLGTNLVQLRYITNDVFNTSNTGGFGITATNINQNVNNGVQNVCVDDTIKFVVEYRNISTITLNNAILHIDIPKDVEFRSSSAGVFNKADNTITINVGTLTPGQSGQVSFDGVVMQSAANRDLLVVPATLSFENPNNGARETAVAYGLATTQNCVRNNGLAGFAFGSGFFPDTLFGWLLLVLVILALIYLIRRMFVVYSIVPRTRTTTTTTQRHYEDLDVPTAPYSHH